MCVCVCVCVRARARVCVSDIVQPLQQEEGQRRLQEKARRGLRRR